MANEKSDDKNENKSNNNSATKPDPETLHTTDPQEHMEGPISSLMHKAEEGFGKPEKTDEEKEK